LFSIRVILLTWILKLLVVQHAVTYIRRNAIGGKDAVPITLV